MKAIVGAVCFVLHDRRVLLLQRNHGAFLGKWDAAGGLVEFGETPAEAAVRKLAEETGLQAEWLPAEWHDPAYDHRRPGQLCATPLHARWGAYPARLRGESSCSSLVVIGSPTVRAVQHRVGAIADSFNVAVSFEIHPSVRVVSEILAVDADCCFQVDAPESGTAAELEVECTVLGSGARLARFLEALAKQELLSGVFDLSCEGMWLPVPGLHLPHRKQLPIPERTIALPKRWCV